MAVLSLREAAEQTEKSKVDIWRAIQEGTLPAQRTEDGGFAVDPASCSAFSSGNGPMSVPRDRTQRPLRRLRNGLKRAQRLKRPQ